MENCEVIPAAKKACSGKCRGGCTKPLPTWVVAACGGMISLFEKDAGGHLALLPQLESAVAPSVEGFLRTIADAARAHQFNQLLIVGSANDVSWIRYALPADVAKTVTAEIEYPLMAGWFKPEAGMRDLAHALEYVFQN